MQSSTTAPHRDGPRSLTQLATDVRTAREVVHLRRMAPVVREDLVMAHHALLQAMEAYVTELTARHLPIPHRLRDDLRLQRDLGTGPPERHAWLRRPARPPVMPS